MPLIKVSGQVNRIVFEGKAIKFWESYPGFNGEPKNRMWTAWFDRPQMVNEGDTITIVGELAAKVAQWTPKDETEPKNIVEFSLQNATLDSVVAQEKKPEPITEDVPF